MNTLSLIALCFIAYNSTSCYAAEYYVPGALTCIGTPEMRQMFAKMQYDARQKELSQQKEQSKQYPKISQNELDRWIAAKEIEIKENKAQYKQAQEKQKHEWHQEYYRKNPLPETQNTMYPYSDKHYTRIRFVTELLLNDHRKTYQPTIKTITCYPPQLLLEYKK